MKKIGIAGIVLFILEVILFSCPVYARRAREILTAKKIADGFKLYSIKFADNGSSISNFSLMLEGMLTKIDKVDLKSDIQIPNLSVKVMDVENIDNLLKEIGMERAEFLRVQGRSIIFKKDGKYIRIKLMKERETYASFIREIEVQLGIKNHESDLELLSLMPTPVVIGEKALFSFHESSLPESIKAQLAAVVEEHWEIGKPFDLNEVRGKYIAVVDIVEDKSYFNYLNNPELSDEEFLKAAKKSMHDLMVLAKHGLFHTSLVDLFHTANDRRYIWMIDPIFKALVMEEVGAGRLDAWQESVKYPNPRESGNTDWEHVFSIDEMMNNPDVVAWLSSLSDRHGEKAINFYIASSIGDYFLPFALIIADRMFKRNELDWQNHGKLTNFITDIFMEGYRIFTDIDGAEIEEAINWERMAKQITFFCSNAYVKYVKLENIPEGIFDSETKVDFGDNKEGTLDDEIGWSNARGCRHLGPVNGPIPLQELIKAIYIMTGFMVSKVAL